MADPVWDKGKYLKKNIQPKNGLAVARMVGHISYLSEKGMQEKFGRKLQEKADYEFSFDADFQVESYLRHQGYTFVERFDANSILYITRAMDYFDLSRQYKGGLIEAFTGQKTKFLVISFSSDWLYTTKENKDTVIALNAAGADVSFSEIKTDKGHDSFLVNEPEFLKTVKEFKVIADLLPKNVRVLDVGCGDGSLMNVLIKEKNIEARGLELQEENVKKCIYKGLSVIEGNAETELNQFPSQSFDFVVLSQTLQAFYNPEKVLRDLLRIGKSVIISIPNFGYWKVRTKLLFFGKMPVTKTLPNTWYNTPNLHMCTIKDLFDFCLEKNIKIDKVIGINEDRTSEIKKSNLEIKNLFSKLGIFLLS